MLAGNSPNFRRSLRVKSTELRFSVYWVEGVFQVKKTYDCGVWCVSNGWWKSRSSCLCMCACLRWGGRLQVFVLLQFHNESVILAPRLNWSLKYSAQWLSLWCFWRLGFSLLRHSFTNRSSLSADVESKYGQPLLLSPAATCIGNT